jgi:hypothetical protein
MGMGMGAGFGMMMPGMIQQAMAAGAAPPAAGTVPVFAPAKTGLSPSAEQPAAPPPSAPAIGAGFAGLSPVTVDPKAMVRSVIQAAGYALSESGDAWQVTVPVGTLRKQAVHIDFGQADQSGSPMIAYWSICGPYLEKNAAALLRYNTSTLHGAFAVKNIGGSDMVVLQTNQLTEILTPLEVSRVLSAIAWQADQVEQQLTGKDEN